MNMNPFRFNTPAWLNTPTPKGGLSAEEALKRAHDAASAYYAMGAQTGVHSMIEWCGVMGEHVKMLAHAAQQGLDPRDVDQHGPTVVTVPGFMVDYFCEKLGCQIKPFIRADKETWRRAIDRWFEGGAK